MLTLPSLLPLWAEVDEFEVENTEFWYLEDGYALSIFKRKGYMQGADMYYGRLFVHEKFAGAVKVIHNGGSLPGENVLCYVEVNPEYRGQKLSVYLLRVVQEKIGQVYRTGSFSQSGKANSKHLELQMIPGGREHVSSTEEYQFINWQTGQFDS